RERLAELRAAFRWTVVEVAAARAARAPAEESTPHRMREVGEGGPAEAKIVGKPRAAEVPADRHLPRELDGPTTGARQTHGRRAPRRGLESRRRRGAEQLLGELRRDHRSRADAGDRVALADQLIVGEDGDVPRDAELGGELAGRW